jgi:hypothetical protein
MEGRYKVVPIMNDVCWLRWAPTKETNNRSEKGRKKRKARKEKLKELGETILQWEDDKKEQKELVLEGALYS